MVFGGTVLADPAVPGQADDSAVTGPPGDGPNRVVVPPSSEERPGDIGKKSHTNTRIVVPPRRMTEPGR